MSGITVSPNRNALPAGAIATSDSSAFTYPLDVAPSGEGPLGPEVVTIKNSRQLENLQNQSNPLYESKLAAAKQVIDMVAAKMNTHQQATSDSLLDNVLVGVGASFVGTWDAVKAIGKGILGVAEFGYDLAFNPDQASQKWVKAVSAVEGGAEAVSSAYSMAEFIANDKQALAYAKDVLGAEAGKWGASDYAPVVGMVIGEAAIGVATGGAASAAKGTKFAEFFGGIRKAFGDGPVDANDYRRALRDVDNEAGLAIASKQIIQGEYRTQIDLALQGRKPDGTYVVDDLTRQGYVLEGQIGQFLDNEGALLRYQEVINNRVLPNGKVVGAGEIDAETPGFIFEVTAKSTPKKVAQLESRVNSTILNPDRKPVIFYAPNVSTPQQVKAYSSIPGVTLIRSMDELRAFGAARGGF